MKRLLSSILSIGVILGLAGSAHAQSAKENVLRWAYLGDTSGMDPFARSDTFHMNFMKSIYDTLLRWDDDLKIEPALAKSWEVTQPGVLRLHLREGVKFHNGSPFAANDVVASIHRAIHENSLVRIDVESVKEAKKVDDHTVDIQFVGPLPIVLNSLQLIHMFDEEWLTEHNALEPADPKSGVEGYISTHANGTGPFMLDVYEPGSKTELVVNPDWWDTPKHNLTRIVFTPIGSDATRVAALISGNVDFIFPAPLQDADRLRNTPGVKLVESAELRVIFLQVNQQRRANGAEVGGESPLKDIRVRKALYQALDVDAIKDKIMRGKSTVTGSWIAPEIIGFEPWMSERQLPYDPEAARALLTEAGYPNGIDIVLSAPTDQGVNSTKIAEALVSMWARAGIKASLTLLPGREQTTRSRAGEYDVWFKTSAGLPYLDASSIIINHFTSNAANNPGSYGNPKVDELAEQILEETDEPKRLSEISESIKLIREDYVSIPLHQQALSWAMRDNITLAPSADNSPKFWNARKD